MLIGTKRQPWVIVPLLAALMMGDAALSSCGGLIDPCGLEPGRCRTEAEAACCHPTAPELTCADEALRVHPVVAHPTSWDRTDSHPQGGCRCPDQGLPGTTDESIARDTARLRRLVDLDTLIFHLPPAPPSLAVGAWAWPPPRASSPAPHVALYIRDARFRC